MSEVHDLVISASEPIDVDGVRFVNCTFESGARLRYAGGEHPRFEDCTFADVSWYFTEAALRTIQLLQAQNLQGEGQALLDDLFRPGYYISE